MPRPRTAKVDETKAKLLARLRDGFLRPGDRFLSARAVADRYGVSYQTAHRLLRELCDAGHLQRRAASGTYVPGEAPVTRGVQLVFHARGRRAGSFGARLAGALADRLDRDRVPWHLTWHDPVRARAAAAPLDDEHFPVIWECPAAVAACADRRRPALLLNDRPPSGIGSVHIDSVSADDFSGGACAAELLRQAAGGTTGAGGARFAVVSGPNGDARSAARVGGFASVLPRAAVVSAGGWFVEDGARAAAAALARGRDGVFCCNDRLAEAVLDHARRAGRPRPRVVGFDDAPVAESLDLTTIAIPWDELIAAAVAVVRRRLAGDPSTASQQIFAPRPVVRAL